MPSSNDAAAYAFNESFQRRFEDLQRMFETPSSDASVTNSDDVKDLANMLATATKGKASSCAPCAALANPLPCASKTGDSGLSWLLIVLLIVGVVLVVFGLFQLFLSSSEQNRTIVTQRNLHGAPHLPSATVADQKKMMPSTAQQTQQAGSGAGQAVVDKKDPESIFPTASDGVTFVFFHATWCGHCKQFRPVYEQVANANKAKASFWAVVHDVLQQNPENGKVGIRGFPTVAVYINGTQADTLVGNQGADALQDFVSKHSS